MCAVRVIQITRQPMTVVPLRLSQYGGDIMQTASVEEARTETARLLNCDPAELEHITADFLSADASEAELDEIDQTRTYYGWNMSYGHRAEGPTYEFNSSATWSLPVCGSTGRYWYYQHKVNHNVTGQRCGNNSSTAVVYFTRR
jgi:hypothetical protein